MAPAKTQPIIVIKKKGWHGGHHGGAWKVAYADFVTALMALFIVLWLMGQSTRVKLSVAGYFNDPKGVSSQLGTTKTGTGNTATEGKPDDALEKFKEKIEQEIKAQKNLAKLSNQIEITVTPEGLRIELIEGKNGTFYELGSPKLSPSGQQLLGLLAAELKTLPNSLLIEGYTDAAQYSQDANYSNWELSADRANSARQLMQQEGVRSDQVTQIRGYGDMSLRVPSNPYDPSNRRIDILVKNDSGQGTTLSAAEVVNGITPLPKNIRESAGAANKSASAGKPPDAPVKTSTNASAKAPANAPGKPPAAIPAAKPSLMDRIKNLLGHKKK
jgi:chemotaxis protein MotB